MLDIDLTEPLDAAEVARALRRPAPGGLLDRRGARRRVARAEPGARSDRLPLPHRHRRPLQRRRRDWIDARLDAFRGAAQLPVRKRTGKGDREIDARAARRPPRSAPSRPRSSSTCASPAPARSSRAICWRPFSARRRDAARALPMRKTHAFYRRRAGARAAAPRRRPPDVRVPRQIIINSTPQEARVATMENARLVEIQIERVARARHRRQHLQGARDARAAGHAGGLRRRRPREGRLPARRRLLPAQRRRVRARRSDLRTDAVGHGASPSDLDAADAPAVAARRAAARPAADRGAPAEGPGHHRPDQQGADGHQGRAGDLEHLPARPLPGLPAAQPPDRRLAPHRERGRARSACARRSKSVAADAGGIIIRTACEGVSKREIQSDLRLLRKLWTSPLAQGRDACRRRRCCTSDLDVILRTIRDLSANDVHARRVDNRRDYQRILDFIDSVMPRWRPRVDLYELRRADLRALRHRGADRQGAGAQGVAQVGRLHRHRPHRGADRDRRQHRPLRRQDRPAARRRCAPTWRRRA